MSSALELNINAEDIVKFTNKLEKLSTTALPNVVRKTLNDVAMDVKKEDATEDCRPKLRNSK